MRDVTDTLRRAVRQAFRFGSAIRTVSNPWLLLACRLWLGQLTLIRAVMVMMAWIAPYGSGVETRHDLRSAAIMLGLIFASIATGLLGMIVVFPVLGHGSWHAYRTMEP